MDKPLRNILMTIQYDGSSYHGYQVQNNAITICQVFQDAVEDVLGKRWDVKGCSRTDTGVHALDYKISMLIDHPIPCERLIIALNRVLPDDIAVIDAREVPLDFHARYNSLGKRYIYKIHNSSIKNPFKPKQLYKYPWKIDEQLLNREAKAFVGTHDFRAFCTGAENIPDTTRTVTRFDVTRNGDLVEMVVEGNGFLHNMVRIMVGTLLGVASGQIEEGAIEGIIKSKDRQRAGKTAPPHGLYLARVYYPE